MVLVGASRPLEAAGREVMIIVSMIGEHRIGQDGQVTRGRQLLCVGQARRVHEAGMVHSERFGLHSHQLGKAAFGAPETLSHNHSDIIG